MDIGRAQIQTNLVHAYLPHPWHHPSSHILPNTSPSPPPIVLKNLNHDVEKIKWSFVIYEHIVSDGIVTNDICLIVLPSHFTGTKNVSLYNALKVREEASQK